MCKTITNFNRIEGTGEISVEILGRGGICYREASREMLIDSEFLAMGGRYDSEGCAISMICRIAV